jgi:hypothetical protein
MESGAQKKEVLLDPLGTRDFSKPSIFKLTNNQPNKTIDIGHNGSSLSLDACGRVSIHPLLETVILIIREGSTSKYLPS